MRSSTSPTAVSAHSDGTAGFDDRSAEASNGRDAFRGVRHLPAPTRGFAGVHAPSLSLAASWWQAFSVRTEGELPEVLSILTAPASADAGDLGARGPAPDGTDLPDAAVLGAMIAAPACSRALVASAQATASSRAAFMARAFACREESVRRGDQPYGAVVVRDGRIIGEGVSAVVTRGDATAHAEREAIRDALRREGVTKLSGCELYGTSRACGACEAAAHRAGIARMFHGTGIVDAGPPAGG
jgi:tRNA(Arg) A34 adenosine deaminase TadA